MFLGVVVESSSECVSKCLTTGSLKQQQQNPAVQLHYPQKVRNVQLSTS